MTHTSKSVAMNFSDTVAMRDIALDALSSSASVSSPFSVKRWTRTFEDLEALRGQVNTTGFYISLRRSSLPFDSFLFERDPVDQHIRLYFLQMGITNAQTNSSAGFSKIQRLLARLKTDLRVDHVEVNYVLVAPRTKGSQQITWNMPNDWIPGPVYIQYIDVSSLPQHFQDTILQSYMAHA